MTGEKITRIILAATLACIAPTLSAQSAPPTVQYCHGHHDWGQITPPSYRCFNLQSAAEAFLREDPPPTSCRRDAIQVANPSTNSGWQIGQSLRYRPHPRAPELGAPLYTGHINDSNSANCGGSGCATEADVLAQIAAFYNPLETLGSYSTKYWWVAGGTQPLPNGDSHVALQAFYHCAVPTRSWRQTTNYSNYGSLTKRADGFCPVGYGLNSSNGFCDSPEWPLVCVCGDADISVNLHQTDTCDATGNPCSPSSGNKSQYETDFVWGRLSFTRAYNSLRQLVSKGAIGEGWTHSLTPRVVLTTPDPYVWFEDERNLFEQFIRFDDGNSRYRSVNQPGQILTKSNGYSLRRSNGEELRFDATGRLVEILYDGTSADDLALTYCEGADASAGSCAMVGALWRVTDRRGRQLEFRYALLDVALPPGIAGSSPQHRLTSIEQDGVPLVQYYYDTVGRLTEVTRAAQSNSREYHYGEASHVCMEGDGNPSSFCPDPGIDAFRYSLTGITDENGTRYADFTFDGYGRATSTRHAGGADLHTLTYLLNQNTRVVYPHGEVRTFSYTGNGQDSFIKLSAVASPDGTSTNGYDSARRLTTRVDDRGTTTTYEYADGVHRTATNDAVGTAFARRIEQGWDMAVNRVSSRVVKDSTGTVVGRHAWTHNARGQVATHAVADPVTAQTRTTTFTYCEAADVAAPGSTCPILGMLKSVDGPRTDLSDITSYSYRASDAANCASQPAQCTYRKGDLWKVTNALGHVTEYLAQDAAARVLSVKDANGVVTDIEYHPRGWLTARKVRGPNAGTETDDAITRIEYDFVGQVTKVTQPDGAFLTYTYDDAHRLTDIADNAGNSIHYTLDAAGNRTKEETKDPTAAVTRALARQVDTLGRIRSQIRSPYADAANLDDPSVKKTQYTFDPNGNTDTITDPLGRVTDNDYDPLDRLSKTISDYGAGRINATVQYEYDARDNLVKVIDPKNLATEYVYNGLNDLAELRSPDTGTTRYTYDSAGNRAAQVDARNVTTQYSYDALNRLTGVVYPSATGLNVTFQYDEVQSGCGATEISAVGRLTRMVDESGETLLCYDRRGNVARKIHTNTKGSVLTVAYTYDVADRVSQITYPSGAKIDYHRDGQARIVRLGYTPLNGCPPGPGTCLPGKPRGEWIVTNATYLPFGPLNQITFGNGSTLTKNYDRNYAIDSIDASQATGLDLEFTVDDVGNITAAGTSVGGAPAETYGYDNLDRLTNVTATGGANVLALTYDATGNRASKRVAAGSAVPYAYAATNHRLSSVGAASRTYDAAGNTTARGDGFTFVYDARNRYTQYKRNNKVELTNNYNGRGERVTKTVGNAVTRFAYDESGRLLAETAATANTDLVWMDDVPVAAVRGSTISYVHADHLGTPRKVVDPPRNVAVWDWALLGNAFGEVAPNQNPDGDGVQFAAGWRFPGQYFDSEAGLNYNYFRDYEPGTGRYVESDPVGLRGGLASYAYADASPFTYVDPFGLWSLHRANPQSPHDTAGCLDEEPTVFLDRGGPQRTGCADIVRCATAHEYAHLVDFYAAGGSCRRNRGRAYLRASGVMWGTEGARSECRAHTVERDCLRRVVGSGGAGGSCGDDCRTKIDDRITEIETIWMPAKCGRTIP